MSSKGFITGYQQDQKRKNIARILELIHESRGISRIDIAKELEIDRSTVTTIVPELLTIGILKEVQVKPTGKGGRPPILLKIEENFGYTIGISIHLTNFSAAVLDLNGKLVHYIEQKTPFAYTEFALNCITILKLVGDLIQDSNIPIIGATIALSGTINPHTNSIDSSLVFQFDNFDFQSKIADHFPYPVFVENDANACAWGELFPPWNRHYSSFLYLLARTTKYNLDEHIDTGMGIGIGVVVDNRMLYGAHNKAGELCSVFWRSRHGLENQVAMPQNLLANMHKDDQVLRDFIAEILLNVVPLSSLFDPDAIIFGGDLKDKVPVIQDVLKTSLSDTYLHAGRSTYSLVAPSKGEHEICSGAACLFLYRLFKQPLEHAPNKDMVAWENIFLLKKA